MAFEGGPLSTLGITPAFINNLAQQTASTGVTQALGQVWDGAGQSFAGSSGQSLAGNLAASAVNVVINSALGTQISGPGGFPINTGNDFLASTVTPFVTSSVAASINQNIQQSLQTAGPFGTVLSGAATSLVSQVFGGLGGAISGAAGGQATNFKMFPGGGGEPPSDYGGVAYTLSDVTFSLQPANQGPQAFGDLSAAFGSDIGTSLPFGDLINADFGVDYPAVNALKDGAMGNFESFGVASGIA
jgi:hypothetical protein